MQFYPFLDRGILRNNDFKGIFCVQCKLRSIDNADYYKEQFQLIPHFLKSKKANSEVTEALTMEVNVSDYFKSLGSERNVYLYSARMHQIDQK